MKKVLLLIAIYSLTLLVGSAQAGMMVNPDGSVAQPFQGWADASRVPTVDSTLVIYYDTVVCLGPANGCTNPGWIAVSQTLSRRYQRWVLLHELGHQFDWQMPAWKRRVFMRIIGPKAPWKVDRPLERFSYAELFADLYADCALATKLREQAIVVNGEVRYLEVRDLRRICKLIRQR